MQWKPIKTYFSDDVKCTAVLLYCPEDLDNDAIAMMVGFWKESYGWLPITDFGVPMPFYHPFRPTHWMPLPAAPAAPEVSNAAAA